MSRAQWGHGFHSGIKKAEEELFKEGYCGLFFHTWENGVIQRQGVVRKKIDDTKYLVSWFSWMDGEQNGNEIISLKSDNTYYTSSSEMRYAYMIALRDGKTCLSENETRAERYKSFKFALAFDKAVNPHDYK